MYFKNEKEFCPFTCCPDRCVQFPVEPGKSISGRHYKYKQPASNAKANMRLFNICTKREFEENGEKKVNWYKAGILKISKRGRLFLRLFHQPEVDFHLFESDKEKPETIQSDKEEE